MSQLIKLGKKDDANVIDDETYKVPALAHKSIWVRSMLMHEILDETIDKFNVHAAMLCERAGIDPSELSRYRNGRRDIGSKKLQKILNSLEPRVRAYFYWMLSQDSNDTTGVA